MHFIYLVLTYLVVVVEVHILLFRCVFLYISSIWTNILKTSWALTYNIVEEVNNLRQSQPDLQYEITPST